MFDDFTDDELDGAAAIARAGTGQGRSVAQILAALKDKHTESERLNTTSAQLRRSQLVDIFELLVEALTKDEEAQEAFGRNEEEVFTETGGKLLNAIIKRHTGLSKQRACCLAMVLRYAVYSRITRADFPEWLSSKENLDEVAREYAATLRGEENEGTELKPQLGDGWDRLIATLQKVRTTGQPVAFKARLQCAPGGKVHFLKKLPKPKK
jgi:hypothetical protein